MIGIDFNRVTFTYPGCDLPAIKEIDLNIPEGAFVGLIGGNNAGKSTLCAAMSGIVPQMIHGKMSGGVRIGDSAISDGSQGEPAELVGMVLQVPGHQLSGIRYTVFEEVAFGLENLGMEADIIVDRVENALEATGMRAVSDRSPFRLSGGQQQRLAIASALALDPAILVLDEPTTFLDPEGTAQVFKILARLHSRGKTIVIAEHRLEWIAEYADWVVALKQGKKVMEGAPEAVLTQDLIREIDLDWTRYTKIAALARSRGSWPKKRPLPASFPATVEGFCCDAP